MALWKRWSVFIILSAILLSPVSAILISAQDQNKPATSPIPEAQNQTQKPSPEKNISQPKALSPSEELQQAINATGNDRAALVRNLEVYLVKYPESPQRPQIYRALVEASLQLRDITRAADYAERIVALMPEDMSITLVAIQLLQRTGDEAALRRAVNYAGRVLTFVEKTAKDDKPSKMSPAEWTLAKGRDRSSILLLRGELYLKLKDTGAAQKDFAASYAALPSAGAAEKLGELAELNKELTGAIKEYARAFALADGANNTVTRREIRQKIGNVWRLAHGSEDGLGEYLLRNYDQVAQASAAPVVKKNASAREVFEFTLRKAPDGTPFPLANTKGEVVVVSFWATWCGPCRALEPQFERVASRFRGNDQISFLEANCDDDESQVAPYLEEVKPRVPVVFADGLDHLLGVNDLPTVVIIDRRGKVAYRAEGFGGDGFERDLIVAARRALGTTATIPPPGTSAP
ncbi:MAG TPA: thioredoxin-like domain-containing protein [Candidatus Acidoferrum sp.]|nr:thioredoxin-like domain-containing protein [Candidatus Acidoferrum sp.]